MTRFHFARMVMWGIAVLFSDCGWALENVKFEGDLVHEPCIIAPEDSTVSLDFGTIVDKYLYAHERTASQTVTVHLSNCDLDLAKMVKVYFIGPESSALKGHLAVNIAGQPGGIALGLESASDGAFIPINAESQDQPITAGDSWIKFSAFIRGEETAIKNKAIIRGPFSATLNFSLFYE